MKVPFFIAIVVVTSQLLLLTYASPKPSPDEFLQCLHSNKFPNPPNFPISKALYTPQNESFLGTLQFLIRNSRFNRTTTPKPLAIVAALHYSHVQSTVLCAKSSGIQVRIRSGGHDYEGLSYVAHVPFVVIDMFNLRKVKIDAKKRLAWVQAGAIFGELYYNVAKKSNNTLAFPGGACFSVGSGGHISGGGYGFLMRKFGLSADNVLDAKIVDAKGRILTRSTMGEDLFWAIRGGGGSNFAIVLSWKLRLVKVPQNLSVFMITKTLEQGATDVVDQWQNVATKMTKDLFVRVQPQAIAGSRGNKTTIAVSFIGHYLGSAEKLVKIMNKELPLLGLKSKDCIEMTWAQSAIFWAESTSPTPRDAKHVPLEEMMERKSNPANHYNKNKSDYVKKPIPKEGLEKIWKKMIELGPNFFMQFNPYGGRMGEIEADSIPFPHRAGNLFMMQYILGWQDASMEAEERQMKGIRELHEICAPYVSSNPREAFWNYKDIELGSNANGNLGFAYDYFKGNVKRMLKVKAEVDPENFFWNELSIPLVKKT